MKVFVFVLMLVVSFSYGQVRPELAGIVQAERDFAQQSVDENIRAAFITNFDDETIAFQKGEPLLGRKDWLEGPANDAYLFWWPVWADIASSGDFGYTTGPVEFGGTQAERKPTGGAYYASVWKKKNGVWKVVADLGSAQYDPAENKKDFASPQLLLTKHKGSYDTAAERFSLLNLDKSYITALNEAGVSFTRQHLSHEARLHRPGRKPLTTEAEISAFSENRKFTHEQVGGGIASSCDMGFTYGRVKVTVSRDGKETILPLCYMRVWKKEEGIWKLVLDVIG